MKEVGVWVQYWKLQHLSNDEVLAKIADLRDEMRPFENRPTSEGFRILNDSTNNTTYALLVEIAQKRKLQI